MYYNIHTTKRRLSSPYLECWRGWGWCCQVTLVWAGECRQGRVQGPELHLEGTGPRCPGEPRPLPRPPAWTRSEGGSGAAGSSAGAAPSRWGDLLQKGEVRKNIFTCFVTLYSSLINVRLNKICCHLTVVSVSGWVEVVGGGWTMTQDTSQELECQAWEPWVMHRLLYCSLLAPAGRRTQ